MMKRDESDSRKCRVCGAPIEVYLGKRWRCRACIRAALSDDAREREREGSRAWKDRNRERNRKRDRAYWHARKAS